MQEKIAMVAKAASGAVVPLPSLRTILHARLAVVLEAFVFAVVFEVADAGLC